MLLKKKENRWRCIHRTKRQLILKTFAETERISYVYNIEDYKLDSLIKKSACDMRQT